MKQHMFMEIAKAYSGGISRFQPYAPAASRQAWEGLPQKLRGDLLQNGERYLGYEYPRLPATLYMAFCREGNRVIFETPYFERRYALNALVLAECVEHKGRFMDDIINGLMLLCEESGWQLPAHNNADDNLADFFCVPDTEYPIADLFACETAAELAMVRYLLGQELEAITPIFTRRIRSEILARVITPYLTRHFHWMGADGEKVNNWTPWCVQNVLIAAYSLDGLDEDTQQKVLLQSAKSLDYFVDSYGEDGCCDEGASYYRAAGLCLFNAIEVLNSVTGDAFAGLYQVPKIQNIAPYIMNVHVGGPYYANFADCAPTAGRAGVREFLYARRVGNEAMMRYAAKDYAENGDYLQSTSMNLFYRLQSAFTEAEIRAMDTSGPITKPDIFYDSVGLMIARDDTFFLAAKGGHNADSHNHNDVGSITVYKQGKPMLIDVGVETYRRQTFSAERYKIWTMQSGYHNVLTFGDSMQLPGEAYCATDVQVSLEPEKASMHMELAGAYPAGTVDSYTRDVVFEKGGSIRVTDTCSPLPEGTFLTLMTVEEPAWSEGVLRIGGLGEVRIEGSQSAEIETIDVTDAKLLREWGPVLYRTKVYLSKPGLSLVIQ